MVRPNLMNERTTMNIVFDSQEIREFEELVGKGNLSREIRAMIKDQLEIRKKEEALLNSDYLEELPSNEIPNLNKYTDFNKYVRIILNDINNLRKATDDRVNLFHLGTNLQKESKITFTKRNNINAKIQYEQSLKNGVSFK